MNSNNIGKVRKYFEGLESRLGYDLVLWGGEHFGYYPQGREHISERRAQKLMQDLIAKNLALPEESYVLDAGCGQGVVACYLAKKYGWRIEGVTVVPFEVEKAKKLARKLGVEDKVHFHLMDYNQLEFPSNHFGGLYAVESLVHSYDLRKTLGEFYRVLKPGGRFALFEYSLEKDDRFAPAEMELLEMIIEESAMVALKKMRHGTFLNYLKDAGFVEVGQREVDKENIRPCFDRFRRLARIPYLFVKALGLRRKFINVTTAIELYPLVDKGLFHYNIFTGRKV